MLLIGRQLRRMFYGGEYGKVINKAPPEVDTGKQALSSGDYEFYAICDP